MRKGFRQIGPKTGPVRQRGQRWRRTEATLIVAKRYNRDRMTALHERVAAQAIREFDGDDKAAELVQRLCTFDAMFR